MRRNIIFTRVLACILAALILLGCAAAAFGAEADSYVPTSRETKPAPEKANFPEPDLEDFTLLYETNLVRYYWREDRDVIAVEDKTTGYCMKTGVDLPFSDDAKDAVKKLIKKEAPLEEILAAAESYADDLNATYVGIANSLITIEYNDGSKVKYISSASEKNAKSALSPVAGTKNQFKLEVTFKKPDISLTVYVTFGESTITYDIPSAEIGGEDATALLGVDITPFLGASGGTMNVLNEETLEWESVANERTPGYVLVPDGSGALIRFVDNTTAFNPYVGDVFGKDYATEMYYHYTHYDSVPINDPVMPVFGIAHGNDQMAFVAWAEQGGEYMDIIVNPDETKSTTYTWAYPRFEYNVEFYQLYDELGNGFFDHLEDIFRHDVKMTYSFLFGDGTGETPAANYAGMALAYRQHLLDTGVLTPMEADREDIPIRLDFIMADSESGIIGTNQVVVTTAEDVLEILTQVADSGITNVNSGLIGWQYKGEALSKPASFRFSGRIGSKGDFRSMMASLGERGIDVSFSRDVLTINREMTNYYNTAIKCVSNWYAAVHKAWILPENLPTTDFSFATPEKAVQWTKKLADKTEDFGTSLTLSGISNVLTSNYNRHGVVTTLQEAIAMYQQTLEEIGQEKKLNLVKPNQYLWKYTDRYLQMNVGNSQYIYETDAVPFLQMVLCGTMEMYAPYANFSFYTQDCILRMIDYNVCPSFILSKDPSWNLADTYSANLYSTEFALYEDKIADIYSQVNGILSQVQGYDWVAREVPENGVVVNTYTNGSQTRCVVINYTESSIVCCGITVPALSAAVTE